MSIPHSSPESFAEQHLLAAGVTTDLLGVNPATLFRRLSPYLHRLATPPTGHARYSKTYINALVDGKSNFPDLPLATFTREFAQGLDAATLVTTTEEIFADALEQQIVVGSRGKRLITAAGITSLTGITQPTVSSWMDRRLLVPETLSGEPYKRARYSQGYFPESQFKALIEWQRPILEPK